MVRFPKRLGLLKESAIHLKNQANLIVSVPSKLSPDEGTSYYGGRSVRKGTQGGSRQKEDGGGPRFPKRVAY